MLVSSERSQQSESLHDMMVRIRADYLNANGYEVSADINGYQPPSKISGHIPDIYAVRGQTRIICEAETCDTIDSEHTKAQYKAFSQESNTDFHVIVPASCLEEAQEYAKSWNISVDKWIYQKEH